MDAKTKGILGSYNPWWPDGLEGLKGVPSFHRPVFKELLEALDSIPQILSIIGPRRIGKTTLLHQLIQTLLKRGADPKRVIYYSFDDPALIREGVHGGEMLEGVVKGAGRGTPPTYLFLDEIQRLEGWELYLKKIYDLRFSVRVAISGSASSPIFKKSRESLLGRVKDYHLLPFSFREYVMYRWTGQAEWLEWLDRIAAAGRQLQGLATGDPNLAPFSGLPAPPLHIPERVDEALGQFFLEGGFPEVWSLPTWVAKQDYLFDHQVKKVIYEDLILATEFRKPELLKQFFISLLERPGQETSVQAISGETGIGAQQIEKYLPLLEMTDLLYRLEKFRKSPLRVRRGKMKFYLVDLALRNAVLRLTDSLLGDPAALGLYAENLVFLALRKWRGALRLDYYRDRDGEIDFVVHAGPRKYVPVEVKYQDSVRASDEATLRRFGERFGSVCSFLVTKRWEDIGVSEGIVRVPLESFLLLFD